MLLKVSFSSLFGHLVKRCAAVWDRTLVEAAYSEDKGSRQDMEDVCVIMADARPDKTTNERLHRSILRFAVLATRLPVPNRTNQALRGAVERVAFFAVVDGHSGVATARFVSEHLHANVMAAGLLQCLMQIEV
jgi:serine/threonine protein phosphatase PrpC